MGEKIEILGSIKVNNTLYDVELNKPVDSKDELQIHIQSEDFRVELSENEFIQILVTVKWAKEKLKQLKKI